MQIFIHSSQETFLKYVLKSYVIIITHPEHEFNFISSIIHELLVYQQFVDMASILGLLTHYVWLVFH